MTESSFRAVKNRTIFTRDNLEVLRGMGGETADLIYLDPPFNSKRQWAAPIGSKAAGAAFKDSWTWGDIDEAWLGEIARENQPLANLIDAVGGIEIARKGRRGSSNKAYLTMMAPRLLEMRRILKKTGSIYLHCDPVMSHSLKLLMDAIFGENNFRNEIVWCYSGGGTPSRDYPRKHDVILRYARARGYFFAVEYKPYKENTRQVGKHSTYAGGGDIDLARGTPVTDWWVDIKTATGWAEERVGYPTQKPLALLNRIIKSSCPEGGMVLDPFCGCATACIAAEKLGRQWIGIDISPKAAELVIERYQNNKDLFNLTSKIIHRTDIPHRRLRAAHTKPQMKDILYGRQKGNCGGCGTHFEYRHFHLDHIVPQSKGGSDAVENRQLLCGSCNAIKGDREMAYLRTRLADIKRGVGFAAGKSRQ